MPTLRLISWNLDGLDHRHTDLRTEAACQTILERAPDVVFLQEVVQRSFFAHLRPWMLGVGYQAAPPMLTRHSSYGCMMFVRPPLKVLSVKREPFEATAMGRSLIRTVVPSSPRMSLTVIIANASMRLTAATVYIIAASISTPR